MLKYISIFNILSESESITDELNIISPFLPNNIKLYNLKLKSV